MGVSSNFVTSNQYIVYWFNVIQNSQSIPDNTSVVTIELWAKRTNSGYTSYGTGTTYITANGLNYNFPITTDMKLTDTPRKMATLSTMNVPHNNDGTKTLSVSGYMTCTSWTSNSQTYNEVLPTIPRASTLTASNFTIGNAIPLSVTEASSSFRYNMTAYCNGVAIASRANITKPTSFTLDANEINSLLTNMGSDNSATVVIYLATFSGGVQAGNTQSTTCAAYSTPSYINIFNNFNVNGVGIGINIARFYSIFTHDLELRIGSTSIASRSGIAVDGTIVLNATEQNILFNAMAYSTTATVSLYCTQKIGSLVRGVTTVATATATIEAGIIPTVTSITATGINATVGGYIKNTTPITFKINGAAGIKGSSISSYNINFNGINYSSSSVNTGVPNFSGSKVATATVTDSRGRTATTTVSVNVIDYNTPTITAFSVQRASNTTGTVDAMGIFAKINHTATISSLKNGATEKNVLTYKLYSKLRNAPTWTLLKTATSLLSLTSFSGFSGYPVTSSYDFKIEVTDMFNVAVIATDTMSTGKVTMSLGKTGVGVGKIWESDALDVEGNVKVNGTITGTTVTGNTISGTNFTGIKGSMISADRGTIATDLGTASEIRWRNYGNNHTIIENSKSEYGTGGNKNPMVPWGPSHPTLMGWNGSSTFGVRVDSAMYADTLASGTTVGTISTITASNWFRSTGATGWYNETYAGGIHMTDTLYVRAYNGKGFSAPYMATDRIYGISREGFHIGSGGCRIDVTGDTMRLFSTTGNDTGLLLDTTGLTFKIGNVAKFNIASNGAKTGGFIELDGMNVGLSPVDSPRVLHQDIIYDAEVEEEGTIIFIDELFAKTLKGYAVFPSNGKVEVVEKNKSSFKVVGFTGKVDFNVIGNRRDMTHQYFDIQ